MRFSFDAALLVFVCWGASTACVPTGVLASGGRTLVATPADEPLEELRGTGGALQEAGRQLARIAAATTPAVVHILAEHQGRNGTIEETGSGVILASPKAQGVFVVTNRHVIAAARLNAIQIHLHDGRVLTPQKKLEDLATDVAVLQIGAPDLSPARWGDSDNLDIGHLVLAMGSPFGLSQSVTLGIISAKDRRSLELGKQRDVINQEFLQTDAAINPGNSGGPLIDLQGRVVGINTAIASQGGGNEGIGFSIPINLVRYVVDQLLEHGRVQRGFLGVRLDDQFDAAAARQYALDRRRGARVVEVYANTPAVSAGIRLNDLILEFDGISIQDENHLIHIVSLTELKRPIRMVVMRDGQQMTLQITLIERPDPQRTQAPPAPPAGGGGARFETTGLSLLRLDDQIAAQIGLGAGKSGLLVMQAPEDSQHESLQLYDVIEAVARTSVTTPAEFDAAIETAEGPVLLRVRRLIDGRSTTRLVLWRR
jgi:serine protease Do